MAGIFANKFLLVGLLVLFISKANSGLFGGSSSFLSGVTSNLLGTPSHLITEATKLLGGSSLGTSIRISAGYGQDSPKTVEEDWSTCGILRRYGYDCESHKVTTSDGYILKMFRVLCPNANISETASRPVMFLMHGLLSSSSIWTLSPENSLAMTMCDSGYDVWLGNARGNEYSSEHIYLNTSSPNFYLFSWAEIAGIDLPIMLNYTLRYTKQHKLSYAGHSQGTTVFLALASLNPALAACFISSAHLLAPIAFTTNWQGLLAEFTPLLGGPDSNSSFVEVELSKNVLPLINQLKGQTYCADTKLPQRVCEEIYTMLFGESKISNRTGIKEILNVFPSSSSTRQLKHFLQEKVSNEFRLYDFGETINLAKYLSEEPLKYKLQNINVTTFLYYSDKDLLAPKADVERLISLLNPNTVKGTHFLPGFYHPDYLIANNVKTLLYSIIIKNIKNLNSQE